MSKGTRVEVVSASGVVSTSLEVTEGIPAFLELAVDVDAALGGPKKEVIEALGLVFLASEAARSAALRF